MFKRSSVWRGLTLVFSLLLAISLMAGSILETYRTSVDAFFNTRSQLTETEVDETGEAWSYVSKFKTAKEAFEGLKEFAIRESQETVALLKNDGNALPLSKDAKITMLGVRSYAPVYDYRRQCDRADFRLLHRARLPAEPVRAGGVCEVFCG